MPCSSTVRWACALSAIWCSTIVAAERGDSSPSGIPTDAVEVDELGGDGVTVLRLDNTLWLTLDSAVVERRSADIPRLSAPIRSLRWKGHPGHPLQFSPEPQFWRLSWHSAPAAIPVIEVRFDAPPVPATEAPMAAPAGDGSVMLHAHQAETHGEKLRFEPQPHKNTVGYWTVPADHAVWQLKIDQPGTFAVSVLQGCGQGQGGSEALVSLRRGDRIHAKLTFSTIDTGHFQNFRWVDAGTVELADAGDYQLQLDAKRIAGVALFDVRAIHLVRQAKGAIRAVRGPHERGLKPTTPPVRRTSEIENKR